MRTLISEKDAFIAVNSIERGLADDVHADRIDGIEVKIILLAQVIDSLKHYQCQAQQAQCSAPRASAQPPSNWQELSSRNLEERI
jgi:hypothetical protein